MRALTLTAHKCLILFSRNIDGRVSPTILALIFMIMARYDYLLSPRSTMSLQQRQLGFQLRQLGQTAAAGTMVRIAMVCNNGV